jgi:LPS sulfotransferase NodH
MTRFLIITQPRSGSAWFMSCLNSHPQIYCPPLPTLFSKHNISPFKRFKPSILQFDSPISPYYQYRSNSLKKRFTHLFFRDKLIHRFLAEIYSNHPGVDSIGYKVNYSQINRYDAMLSWIKDNDIKIIHLIRTNLLKRLVSHKIANIRNLQHSTVSVDPIKVHIDTSILENDFRRRQQRFEKYRKRFSKTFNMPFIEISYESLLSNFDTELKTVLRFVEVDPFSPLSSDQVKVNPDRLEDIIENYDEVRQVLFTTDFKHFLI